MNIILIQNLTMIYIPRNWPTGKWNFAGCPVWQVQDRLLREVPSWAPMCYTRWCKCLWVLCLVTAGQLWVAARLHRQIWNCTCGPKHVRSVPQGLSSVVPEGDKERRLKELCGGLFSCLFWGHVSCLVLVNKMSSSLGLRIKTVLFFSFFIYDMIV